MTGKQKASPFMVFGFLPLLDFYPPTIDSIFHRHSQMLFGFFYQPLAQKRFLLVKKENSTCELALCVAGFSFLVLCVCCEREKKGAAACFALQVRYFACKESHGTFP